LHGGCVVSILASLGRSSRENTTYRFSISSFFLQMSCLCEKGIEQSEGGIEDD